MSRGLHSAVALLVLPFAAGCGEAGGPGSGPPATLALVAGDGQTGTVGRPVRDPLTVKVADADGNGVRGIGVSWEVASGGGSVSAASVTTNSAGEASVQYTLGTVAGADNQLVRARVPELSGSPVTFTASAEPDVASRLAGVSGIDQEGPAGQMLPAPLVVAARDQFRNPVSGVRVTWAVATGGGSISATVDFTNSSGQSGVRWTLGPTPGQQTATASAGTLSGSPVVFVATATGSRAARR